MFIHTTKQFRIGPVNEENQPKTPLCIIPLSSINYVHDNIPSKNKHTHYRLNNKNKYTNGLIRKYRWDTDENLINHSTSLSIIKMKNRKIPI